jgi:hypothetical protein
MQLFFVCMCGYSSDLIKSAVVWLKLVNNVDIWRVNGAGILFQRLYSLVWDCKCGSLKDFFRLKPLYHDLITSKTAVTRLLGNV